MSSYRLYKNSSKDYYDYTMDRILKSVDNQERSKVEQNYIAQVITGDGLGGDTTTPQQNVKYVNLNGKLAMSFKIRFIEKSSKFNNIEDPFNTTSDAERQMLISMHDEALLEISGLPVIPKFGDKVVCSRLDGRIFIIDKVLTNESIFMSVLSGNSGGLAGMFANGLTGLLGDGGLSSRIGLSGKDRYSVGGKSAAMEGTVYRPRVRTYIGPRPEWNGKEIENGVFIKGFHEKTTGVNLGAQPIFIKDIVPGFKSLAAAYEQKFGVKIKLTDHFRSWAGQVSVRKRKGNIAAKPGRSNHGWGLAFDYDPSWKGQKSFGSETYKWMYQNAPTHGFFSPKWARPDGSNPEAWHFEWAQPGKLYKK